MSGITKTPEWAPVHEEDNQFLLEESESRPSGIPPPAYQKEYTPAPAAPAPAVPAWKRLHSAPRENFKNSPLLRLAEPLLIKIMNDYCEPEDVLRLRHTSRTFMRIFDQKQDFSSMWLEDGDEQGLSSVWASPKLAYPEQIQRLCSSCLPVRGGSDEDLLLACRQHRLWCSACTEYHSELHFSHGQRAEEDGERICIGREGSLKLCEHESLTWAQVRSLARGKDKPIVCLHDNGNDDSYSGSNSCDSCNDYKRVDCEHVDCPHANGLVTEVTTCESGYELCFSMSTHVPFGRGPASEKPSWCSVYKAIHEAVTNPRDKHTLMPSRLFAGCNPLRAFDPNLCSCLDWHVLEHENKGTGPRDGFKWLLSGEGCGHWRDDAIEDEHAGGQWAEIDPDTDRCHGARHGFDVDAGRRSISVDFRQCGDDGNMLVLVQSMRVIIEGPTDPAWEDLIDGRSIRQKRDLAMRGKTWCAVEDTPDGHRCAVAAMKRTGRTLREIEWHCMHPHLTGSETSESLQVVEFDQDAFEEEYGLEDDSFDPDSEDELRDQEQILGLRRTHTEF